ncbi:DUF6290 family protein [Tissierella praeacuta]|uniref:DUF6290 family protein n=1 Tax=Tissierella praeacuta TaxID=43131 RepID=UPI0028AA6774|nr:hypothetical protein [Tissierella praeacuta]
MDYKTEKKSIRFSQKELMIIKKKAEKAKLSLSEYIRQSALEKDIVVIEELKDFMKGLISMNRNLNQLTILCHQGKITCVNLENVEKELIKINENINLITMKARR